MASDYTNIPDFFEKTSRTQQNSSINYHQDEVRNARDNSLNRQPIRVKKTRRKINIGHCVAATVGAFAIANVVFSTIPKFMNEVKNYSKVSEYIAPLNEVISENTHRTQDNSDYWINDVAVGSTFHEMIENGMDEIPIAYTVATRLTEDYQQDELQTIFDVAFGQTPDEFANSRGYDGIDDPAFIQESENTIYRQMEAQNYQTSLASMFDSENEVSQVEEKGMGGK